MHTDNMTVETSRFFVTRHARQRLGERFPGLEREVISLCQSFYAKHAQFLRGAPYVYRRGNLVAVIAAGILITVYPHKQGREWVA